MKQTTVKMDEKLIAYMEKNGYRDVAVFTKNGNGCCSGSFITVKARFVKPDEPSPSTTGYESVDTALGKLYYHPEQVTLTTKVDLILNQFFGMTVVQVLGVDPKDERFCRAMPL